LPKRPMRLAASEFVISLGHTARNFLRPPAVAPRGSPPVSRKDPGQMVARRVPYDRPKAIRLDPAHFPGVSCGAWGVSQHQFVGLSLKPPESVLHLRVVSARVLAVAPGSDGCDQVQARQDSCLWSEKAMTTSKAVLSWMLYQDRCLAVLMGRLAYDPRGRLSRQSSRVSAREDHPRIGPIPRNLPVDKRLSQHISLRAKRIAWKVALNEALHGLPSLVADQSTPSAWMARSGGGAVLATPRCNCRLWLAERLKTKKRRWLFFVTS